MLSHQRSDDDGLEEDYRESWSREEPGKKVQNVLVDLKFHHFEQFVGEQHRGGPGSAAKNKG